MKRAQSLSLFFVVPLFLFICFCFYAFFSYEASKHEQTVKDDFQQAADTSFASALFEKRVEGKSIGLHTVLVYEQGDLGLVESLVDNGLKEEFHGPVCWRITIGESSVEQTGSCLGEKHHASLFLPSTKALLVEVDVW